MLEEKTAGQFTAIPKQLDEKLEVRTKYIQAIYIETSNV